PAASYDWRKLAESGSLLGGEVMTIDGRAVVRVSNTNAVPLQVQLFRIDQPAITDTVYALTGELRYDRVEGAGYLEMNNYFAGANGGPSAGPFFSRTLAEAGDMRKIAGTANWRRFMLPFDRTGAAGAPTRLELNVF